jgi:hypothetical protein
MILAATSRRSPMFRKVLATALALLVCVGSSLAVEPTYTIDLKCDSKDGKLIIKGSHNVKTGPATIIISMEDNPIPNNTNWSYSQGYAWQSIELSNNRLPVGLAVPVTDNPSLPVAPSQLAVPLHVDIVDFLFIKGGVTTPQHGNAPSHSITFTHKQALNQIPLDTVLNIGVPTSNGGPNGLSCYLLQKDTQRGLKTPYILGGMVVEIDYAHPKHPAHKGGKGGGSAPPPVNGTGGFFTQAYKDLMGKFPNSWTWDQGIQGMPHKSKR